MAQYLALFLTVLNRTLVVSQFQDKYCLRGVLEANPYNLRKDTLARIDMSVVDNLPNQTMYGFQPVFKFDANEVTDGLSVLSNIQVAYESIHAVKDGETRPTTLWAPLSSIDYYADAFEYTHEDNALLYYFKTAYTKDTVPELVVAKQYWPDELLDLPGLVEPMPVGTVVQLIGDKGSLAMGEVVNVQRYGHMIVLSAIAQWKNVEQIYTVRTERTTSKVPSAEIRQVERGFITHLANNRPLVFQAISHPTPMRLGVAIQPAPGGVYGLSQLEIELRDGKYLPRANANFDYHAGEWVPLSCSRLADNFVGNIHNGMQQLMNVVGPYTLHLGKRTIRVNSGDTLRFETVPLGMLTSDQEPLIDVNAEGF